MILTGNVKQCLEQIEKEFAYKDNLNECLKKENARLRDEAYKDSELQRLRQENEKLRLDYYRGFPISEEEQKNIKEWQEEHDKKVHDISNIKDAPIFKSAIGGSYSYEFTPTSIGVIGKCCCRCGAQFTFHDI